MDCQLQVEAMENEKENEKQKLEAELAQVEILLSRINELEAKAQANSSNPHNDEGSGERSSSQAEMPGKPMGDVAFTKERSAVGARMTVASSSSDVRAGQKREAEDAIPHSKRVKPMSPVSSRHTHSTLHSSDETSSAQRGNENPRNDVWEKALEVLSDMKKTCPDYWAYEMPVVERWPSIREEYERVIDNPMDLGIVRDRILNRFYDTPYRYQTDVKLTFQNAMKFNAKESTYYVAASKLLKQFNNRFRTVDRMWKNPGYVATKGRQGRLKKRVTIVEPKAKELTPEEESDAPAPETDSEPEAEAAELEPELEPPPPPPPVKRAQSVTPAMRKPGNPARGRNKKTVQWSGRPEVRLNPRLGRSTHSNAYGGQRALTDREKRKLAALVVKFPPDRTRKVLAIIKERNPGMDTNAEIDLDALDQETQFELYKLAMNWQKSRNKAHNKKYREESEAPQVVNTENTDIDIMGLDEEDEDEDAVAALKLQQSKDGEVSSSSESESGSDTSDSENSSGDSSGSDESDAESEKDVDVDSDKG